MSRSAAYEDLGGHAPEPTAVVDLNAERARRRRSSRPAPTVRVKPSDGGRAAIADARDAIRAARYRKGDGDRAS